MKNEECPGCMYCEDCDVWDGEHFWVDYDEQIPPFKECDLCGLKEFDSEKL